MGPQIGRRFITQPQIRRRLHGFYELDFVCFNDVIVEVKASSAAAPADYAQVLNYLAVSGHEIAMLITFGRPSLEYRHFALSEP